MEPEKALLQDIASSQAVETSLPPLKIEQNWLEELIQWFNLQEIIASIFRWLANKTHISLDFAVIIQALGYIAIVMIAFVVAFALWRFLATLNRMELSQQNQKSELLISEFSLDQQLKLLLRKKEYAKALRCRWRIFLEHNSYSAHLTPLSYTRNEEPLHLDLDELYLLMFGSIEPSAEQFEENSTALDRNTPK